jgi:nucleotide-binding universal stress UspA family protein
MAGEEAKDISWEVNKPFHFVVAVDGSKGSRACYEDVCSLYRTGDQITIVTVASQKEKTHLKFEETPKAIKEYYENRCAGLFPKDKYAVAITIKAEGEDTSKALLTFLDKKLAISPDFLVVGFVGRKGSKTDPTVFGSVTDMSLRSAHMPAIISKNMVTAESNHLFVCVDGSDRAHLGVLLAMRFLRPKTGDRVTVASVEDLSDRLGAKGKFTTDSVTSKYTSFCAENPAATFRLLTKGKDIGVADTLLEAAEDDATHIICGVDGVGSHAAGKKDILGSVSDRIVRGSTCTVITVQGRHAIYESPFHTAGHAGHNETHAVGADGKGHSHR